MFGILYVDSSILLFLNNYFEVDKSMLKYSVFMQQMLAPGQSEQSFETAFRHLSWSINLK